MPACPMMLQQRQQQLLIVSHNVGLSRFDTAVADSQITCSPTTPIPFTDNGFKPLFHSDLP